MFCTRMWEIFLINMANGFRKIFLSSKTGMKENGLYACSQITAGGCNEIIWKLNINLSDLTNEEIHASVSHLIPLVLETYIS